MAATLQRPAPFVLGQPADLCAWRSRSRPSRSRRCVYVIVGGFRTTPQIVANPAGLPDPWVWDNYARVLTQSDFWSQAFNSAVIALGTTLAVVVLGVCAAYVLARYTFRGREALYTFFTLGLLFPAGAAILPLYLMLRDLNLVNSYYAVILPQVAFSLPLTIVILRPFLTAIPRELEDAAAIDGTGRLGFLWRITLPLSGPALVTVGDPGLRGELERVPAAVARPQ